MLIRHAELDDGIVADVRIAGDRIVAIGELAPLPDEAVVEANSGRLLPGLHDHHIHIAALAAALASVDCTPATLADGDALAACLRDAGGDGWLRGIGYCESSAGMLDAAALDAMLPDRPVRIQHRTGRMWFLNSAALDLLLAEHDAPPGLDRATGRLFDEDRWLRDALGGTPPCFAAVGAQLARAGVTGVTEISPANDAAMGRHFAAERAAGHLPQRVLLCGRLDLAPSDMAPSIALGAAKLHLHEADLPPLDDAVAFIRAAHHQDRRVAVHCATAIELLFILAAFEEAGTAPGDRIEHASIADDDAIARIAALGLAVVTQPHFIAERGDMYVRDVDAADRPYLYRLRAFLNADVTLAAGSDAPYGGTDPWAAMAAAVARRTRAGLTLGAREALTPEQALDLYLRHPQALDRRRTIAIGAPADLCLLDRPWTQAREALSSANVRLTVGAGCILHATSIRTGT